MYPNVPNLYSIRAGCHEEKALSRHVATQKVVDDLVILSSEVDLFLAT
jgi:hypothetical protein